MRTCSRLAAALVAATVTVFLGAGPASAAPAILVVPDGGLVHDQVVTVSGSGYTAGTTVYLGECTAGATSLAQCDTSDLVSVTVDATGSFSASFAVERVITTPASGNVDCASSPGACVLGAADSALTQVATTPLSFNPNGPLPVPLEVEVTDVTAAAGRNNWLLLEGTVSCTQPADVYISGRLRQVFQRFFIVGTFSTSLFCDKQEPFTVVVRGENGVLRHGKTELDLSAFAAADGESDEFTLSAKMRVHPK